MSIRKYSYVEDPELARELPFSYFSSAAYLDFAAYTLSLETGERLLVSQDLLFPQTFPCLFLPKNKELWNNLAVTFATSVEREAVIESGRQLLIDKLLSSPEYYYQTDQLIKPTGKYASKVRQFENAYKYELHNECSKEQIIDFYKHWKSQRTRESLTFNESEEFLYFCLDNLDKYSIRQIYVKVAGKLVGFAWGELHSLGKGSGLHLKADYGYEGLGRFLYYHLALLLKDCSEITLGNAPEEGLKVFKERLGPSRETPYYYLLIGE
jgi:hypothetical protein